MDFSTAFENINWISVLSATVSCFLIGGLWYGPLFGTAWMTEFGITPEDLKNRSAFKTFGLSLLLAFIAAFVLELFIGPNANLAYGAIAGFLASFGWVATYLGMIYLFEIKSLRAYAINAGYCVSSLTIMGVILGSW